MTAAAAAQRPKMRLVLWKPIAKGSLRGFVTVELPIGLKLIDCAVFVATKGAWASLPAKPQLDKDNPRQRIGVDGIAIARPWNGVVATSLTVSQLPWSRWSAPRIPMHSRINRQMPDLWAASATSPESCWDHLNETLIHPRQLRFSNNGSVAVEIADARRGQW